MNPSHQERISPTPEYVTVQEAAYTFLEKQDQASWDIFCILRHGNNLAHKSIYYFAPEAEGLGQVINTLKHAA